jgi:hypothetical protein
MLNLVQLDEIRKYSNPFHDKVDLLAGMRNVKNGQFLHLIIIYLLCFYHSLCGNDPFFAFFTARLRGVTNLTLSTVSFWYFWRLCGSGSCCNKYIITNTITYMHTYHLLVFRIVYHLD